MNFSQVKKIEIPEGEAIKITDNSDTVIWKKSVGYMTMKTVDDVINDRPGSVKIWIQDVTPVPGGSLSLTVGYLEDRNIVCIDSITLEEYPDVNIKMDGFGTIFYNGSDKIVPEIVFDSSILGDGLLYFLYDPEQKLAEDYYGMGANITFRKMNVQMGAEGNTRIGISTTDFHSYGTILNAYDLAFMAKSVSIMESSRWTMYRCNFIVEHTYTDDPQSLIII